MGYGGDSSTLKFSYLISFLDILLHPFSVANLRRWQTANDHVYVFYDSLTSVLLMCNGYDAEDTRFLGNPAEFW